MESVTDAFNKVQTLKKDVTKDHIEELISRSNQISEAINNNDIDGALSAAADLEGDLSELSEAIMEEAKDKEDKLTDIKINLADLMDSLADDDIPNAVNNARLLYESIVNLKER